MKLCIDCKYYVDKFEFAICSHPNNLSPVDGKPVDHCMTLRATNAPDKCGMTGAWFEVKKESQEKGEG